ncbi:helix-turn-helix domain-containing protein [Kocuria flava]|uniref:helix-turn-helix domain-containing protein n=1 Tax=Kocuria flava TaxID=446860 RepID=UPI002F91D591
MSQHPPTTTAGLHGREAERLAQALAARDVTVFVDGTALRLPGAAREAVLDLLARLARGEEVTVASGPADAATAPAGPGGGTAPGGGDGDPGPGEELLTTAQAAALAGISHTYLRNLSTQGAIPVQYRGTHRRFRAADVRAWVAAQGARGR